MSDEIREHAITTLAELDEAIAAAIAEARHSQEDIAGKLAARLRLDVREVISHEADRIARPPYRTRRERQQEREPA